MNHYNLSHQMWRDNILMESPTTINHFNELSITLNQTNESIITLMHLLLTITPIIIILVVVGFIIYFWSITTKMNRRI